MCDLRDLATYNCTESQPSLKDVFKAHVHFRFNLVSFAKDATSVSHFGGFSNHALNSKPFHTLSTR